MSIKEIAEKIKRLEHLPARHHDLFVAALIVLVAFGSFGLGRLSVAVKGGQPLRIEGQTASVAAEIGNGALAATATVTEPPVPQGGGYYVGSKNGNKYHFPWCSGAVRIKEDNLVTFESRKVAEAAGYTPAANCKGL